MGLVWVSRAKPAGIHVGDELGSRRSGASGFSGSCICSESETTDAAERDAAWKLRADHIDQTAVTALSKRGNAEPPDGFRWQFRKGFPLANEVRRDGNDAGIKPR